MGGHRSTQNLGISNAKLLGIAVDNPLKFYSYFSNLVSKSNNKLSAFARMIKYLDPPKKRVLVKACFESQFKYCPLARMFHSCQLNKRINRFRERAVRLIYGTKYSRTNKVKFVEDLPLKKLKWYDLHRQTISLQIF